MSNSPIPTWQPDNPALSPCPCCQKLQSCLSEIQRQQQQAIAFQSESDRVHALATISYLESMEQPRWQGLLEII